MRLLDPITRSDFQKLCDIRVREAATLLASGQYEGAYYLAGYAVECALKACICRAQLQYQFPPKPDVVRRIYNHNVRELVAEARLDGALPGARQANPGLDASWGIVEKWSEQSRYALPEQLDAQALYAAVADPTDGVLQWLAQYW